VADLGEGPGGPGEGTQGQKKEEMIEGRKAGGARKTPAPLAPGMDPPLLAS